jgi:hypothetical protein
VRGMNWLMFYFLPCLTAVLVGCAPERVPEGKLKTPGVTISGEGNLFVIRSGEVFPTPFAVDTFSKFGKWDFNNIVEKWDEALAMGAKRVRISVPSQDEPLYGVLLLGTVQPGTKVAAARSYLLEVPPNYVEAAQDGKISVIYEQVPYKQGQVWFSWALWMSDRPFRTKGR